MTDIKFSILIPVYNVDRYLSFCLDSICSQSYTNFEVIAVNDGSTDQSAEILQKYADKDKRIVVINSENKGVSAARNIAIEKASGVYVWMVDADDLIAPDALLTLSNVIQKTSPDIVTFRYQKLYKNKKEPQASSPNCEQRHQEKFDFFRSIFDKSDKSSHYTGGYVWLRVFKKSLIKILLSTKVCTTTKMRIFSFVFIALLNRRRKSFLLTKSFTATVNASPV